MNSSLAKKLKLKPKQQIALINSPHGYLSLLRSSTADLEVSEKLNGKFEWIQVFVQNKLELQSILPQIKKVIQPDGIAWISYPKQSSKITSDLNRDRLLEILLKSELKIITLVSIDNSWSAFSVRPYRQGEARQRKSMSRI